MSTGDMMKAATLPSEQMARKVRVERQPRLAPQGVFWKWVVDCPCCPGIRWQFWEHWVAAWAADRHARSVHPLSDEFLRKFRMATEEEDAELEHLEHLEGAQ